MPGLEVTTDHAGVRADTYEGTVMTNLADIIGVPRSDLDLTPHQEDRVVGFYMNGISGLTVVEQCDEWFGIDLDADQLGKLIDWLTKTRIWMEGS